MADNGTRVFVGGPFSRLAGKDHYSLAMVNNTTGAAYSMPAASAIPKPTATCTTRVKDIDTLGNKVFVSNGGDGRGCYDGVLAADVTTGKLLWKNNCLGATEAIKAIGDWVYKGSHAHDCSSSGAFPEGTGTHYLLVESGINGKIGPWFPNTDANPNSTTKVGPLAFASGGNDLWVGGDFLHVNGNDPAGTDPVHQRRRRRGAGDTEGTRTVQHGGQPGVGELQGRLRPGQPDADLQRVPGGDEHQLAEAAPRTSGSRARRSRSSTRA